MDEAQLEEALRQAQMGNNEAFGRIYQEFFARVLGLCRKLLGSGAAAEDAASEVFERARGSLADYDLDRPFDRWILTVASRHCLNQLRRRRVERRLFADDGLEAAAPAASLSPLAACENEEQRRHLRGAIDGLPESARLVLVLKYYGDLSHDEIASQLGITRNNVAVSLHRAKQMLRRRVAERPEETP
jgi:RNA polymerase sigma-70 factor (ECF subfamily)